MSYIMVSCISKKALQEDKVMAISFYCICHYFCIYENVPFQKY